MVYMKKETSLNLSKSEIGTGNILAVAANIVARFLTGCAALETPLSLANPPFASPILAKLILILVPDAVSSATCWARAAA